MDEEEFCLKMVKILTLVLALILYHIFFIMQRVSHTEYFRRIEDEDRF